MATLELTVEEARRLLSMVRGTNSLSKQAEDWPEQEIDESIERKLIMLDVDRLKSVVMGHGGACSNESL